MEWKVDKNRAICPQISEQLCALIANGVFKPNEQLMSVRDIAVAAGVNPNTVQKSLESLAQQGLLYSVRGSGWFVAEDIRTAKDTLYELAKEKTKAYFDDMAGLGFSADEIIKFVEEFKNE